MSEAYEGLFLLNHPPFRITEGNPATPTIDNEGVTRFWTPSFICHLHTICIRLKANTILKNIIVYNFPFRFVIYDKSKPMELISEG